jgi:hypothetical protein
MMKRSGRVKVRYSATEFGLTDVWKEEPKIVIPPRRFTLSLLEGLAKSLEAKRAELENSLSQLDELVPENERSKIPPLSFQTEIDYYRQAIRDYGDSPETRRILTKWLVDFLRRDVFSKYYDVARRFEGMGDYLKAASYMNEYAVLFGIPFTRRRHYPWVVNRVMNQLHESRRKPPFDAIQLWKDSYQECFAILRSRQPTMEDLRKYHKLQSDLSWLNFYSE